MSRCFPRHVGRCPFHRQKRRPAARTIPWQGGLSMNASISVALYARVSSQRQAEELTIDSQVVALREQIARDDLAVGDDRCFLDEGYSGSVLVRPALERVR